MHAMASGLHVEAMAPAMARAAAQKVWRAAALVLATVTFALLALCPVRAQAADLFNDTPADSWYVTGGYLDYVVDNGLMMGMTDGSGNATGYFDPEGQISRAQVATILYRYANPDSVDTTDPAHYARYASFIDVDGGLYYTASVEWCYQNGIVTGYKNEYGQLTGFFGPNDPITRAELAAVAYRFAAYCGYDVENFDWTIFNGTAQSDQVPAFAQEPMAWCADMGIIEGSIDLSTGIRYLLPYDNASRAQMTKVVTVLVRDVINGPAKVYPVEFIAVGKTFSLQQLERRALIEDPGIPVNDACTFTGWDPVFVPGETWCTGYMTFVATWVIDGEWDPDAPPFVF